MVGRVEMPGGVLILRIVTAAHMSTGETEAQVYPLSPVLRQSSQPRACGVTFRIWLRCVHGVTISLFLPFIQQKHIFSFGMADQFMTFNTLIRLTLFIEPCINCSSCDGAYGVLSSLYNVTRTYASSSSHGTQSH